MAHAMDLFQDEHVTIPSSILSRKMTIPFRWQMSNLNVPRLFNRKMTFLSIYMECQIFNVTSPSQKGRYGCYGDTARPAWEEQKSRSPFVRAVYERVVLLGRRLGVAFTRRRPGRLHANAPSRLYGHFRDRAVDHRDRRLVNRLLAHARIGNKQG